VATSSKLTVRVEPSRRTETIVVKTTGRFATLNLATGPLWLGNQPLTSATTAKEYWTAILNLVIANLPD
jgi:hypothetical protein